MEGKGKGGREAGGGRGAGEWDRAGGGCWGAEGMLKVQVGHQKINTNFSDDVGTRSQSNRRCRHAVAEATAVQAMPLFDADSCVR